MKWAAAGLSLAALAAGATLLLKNGGSDAAFSAETFVEAANERDAGIVLGDPLEFAQEGQDLRTVRFDGPDPSAPAPPAGDAPRDVHGAGSLAIFDTDGEATAEYRRCEAAGLLCFRVSNVALTFAGTIADADVDRLTSAISEMESG